MAFLLTAGMALLFVPANLAVIAATQRASAQGISVYVVELLGTLGMIVGCVSSQTL